MKKILSILTILFTFSFTSHSYSKTEIHWWFGNSGFLGDVIIEIANRFNANACSLILMTLSLMTPLSSRFLTRLEHGAAVSPTFSAKS